MQRVARLQPGSRVALIAPAGPIDGDRLERAQATCEELGLVPVPGKAVLSRWRYLAGDDDARAADLQWALDTRDIDAVWALRGGYGIMRILPRIELAAFGRHPKAYIGFSDNTALHLKLSRVGAVSFHGPHAGGDFPPFTAMHFKRALFEGDAQLDTPVDAPLEVWSHGESAGRLTGGNLALLAAAAGTPYSLRARDAIVFIEDIGEPAYRVDRLFTQLIDCGALEGARGFVIGQFTDCGDDVFDTIRERLSGFDVPIVANAPFGHVADNWTIPVGARARLTTQPASLTLLETGVLT